MPSLLDRIRGTTDGKRNHSPADNAQPDAESQATPEPEPRVERSRHRRRLSPSPCPPPKTPNAPQRRLLVNQKVLYERMLPGKAFVSAHVNRLQHGYYESSALHEPILDNVYFVSVHFVFHPYNIREHRFKSALIKVSIHGHDPSKTPNPFQVRDGEKESWYKVPKEHPKILKHAPELIYGAVSPENLQWNFSLSSSLGISQAPLSASVNPKGSMKSSYKAYDMMSIQGSLRSISHPLGSEYDLEDSMAVWTLEENLLQRSGLPRDFDFVLLIQKPDRVPDIYLTVDVDAEIEGWLGSYPQWYTNLSKYMPNQDLTLSFTEDIGQRFMPITDPRGFNFADLPCPLEEYVTMPGTVYPTNDTNGEDRKFKNNGLWRTPLNDEQPPNDPSDPARGKVASPKGHHGQRPAHPTPPKKHTSSRSQHQHQHPHSHQTPPSNQSHNRHSWNPDTVNVREMLEHSYPRSPESPESRRYSDAYSPDAQRIDGSPLSNHNPSRQPSIRRRRSRSGLKEYGAQQALHEYARDTLKENEHRRVRGDGAGKMNGDVHKRYSST